MSEEIKRVKQALLYLMAIKSTQAWAAVAPQRAELLTAGYAGLILTFVTFLSHIIPSHSCLSCHASLDVI